MLYAIGSVVSIIIVAVIVAVSVVRRRRSKINAMQTTVMYTQTEPAIKLDAEDDTTEHIYEEIQELPLVYDHLRFNTERDPKPLSQHTLAHYDNRNKTSVLKRNKI